MRFLLYFVLVPLVTPATAHIQTQSQNTECTLKYVSSIKAQFAKIEKVASIEKLTNCKSDPVAKVLTMEKYELTWQSQSESILLTVYFEEQNDSAVILATFFITASLTKNGLTMRSAAWFNEGFIETGSGSVARRYVKVAEGQSGDDLQSANEILKESLLKRMQ